MIGSSNGTVTVVRGTDGAQCQNIRLDASGRCATAGATGVLCETIVVDDKHWACPVGKFIAIGILPQTIDDASAPEYLGPLLHVIDAVELLPCLSSPPLERRVAAATFGGVCLWERRFRNSDSERSTGAQLWDYTRFGSLPAARASPDADLACDGWARSLVASPDGEWLAAWVTVASEAPNKLWLWRTADGADFECVGFHGPITALAWRADSCQLVTCSGNEVKLWTFQATRTVAHTSLILRGGPGGRAPEIHRCPSITHYASAAFGCLCPSPSVPNLHVLACGTACGKLVVITLPPEASGTCSHTAGTSVCTGRAVMQVLDSTLKGAVTHLAWATGGFLVCASPAASMAPVFCIEEALEQIQMHLLNTSPSVVLTAVKPYKAHKRAAESEIVATATANRRYSSS